MIMGFDLRRKFECGFGFRRSGMRNSIMGFTQTLLENDPSLLNQTIVFDRYSPLHIAVVLSILSMLLFRSVNLDVFNSIKQVLMFDMLRGRTCLHYAAYYGHPDCVKDILSAAQSSPVAASWLISSHPDGKGTTPLHLAARQKRPECVHILLDNGALVSSSMGGNTSMGGTPLHLAARGGSLDCVRELLAWGADRLHKDASGRIPYIVALKHGHGACAVLLNPTSAEPLVWPSPLKFISELNPEAKALLERALMDGNREREKTNLKGSSYSLPSPSQSDTGVDDSISEASDKELCCICFEQVCTIEVQNCGHQMCASCTLALCCHNKPNPSTASITAPVCPFCRSTIARLTVAKVGGNTCDDNDRNGGEMSSSKLRKSRRSRNLNEGSSSVKGLSAVTSFGKMARGSNRIAVDNEWVDKQ